MCEMLEVFQPKCHSLILQLISQHVHTYHTAKSTNPSKSRESEVAVRHAIASSLHNDSLILDGFNCSRKKMAQPEELFQVGYLTFEVKDRGYVTP
jgi:RNA-binding protein YlmH